MSGRRIEAAASDGPGRTVPARDRRIAGGQPALDLVDPRVAGRSPSCSRRAATARRRRRRARRRRSRSSSRERRDHDRALRAAPARAATSAGESAVGSVVLSGVQLPEAVHGDREHEQARGERAERQRSFGRSRARTIPRTSATAPADQREPRDARRARRRAGRRRSRRATRARATIPASERERQDPDRPGERARARRRRRTRTGRSRPPGATARARRRSRSARRARARASARARRPCRRARTRPSGASPRSPRAGRARARRPRPRRCGPGTSAASRKWCTELTTSSPP